MANDSGELSLISPTAKLVAYWRQFSDIPYAKEVAEYAQAEDVVKTMFTSGSRGVNQAWAVPYIEARYKCIMRTVDRLGIKQVLELASGLSLRGLATTRQRQDILYVETDLEGMHQEKAQIVRDIVAQEGAPQPENLRMLAANALDLGDLEQAVAAFDPSRPLAIVNEGLCQYLSLDEKRLLAQNIHKLLSRFGGAWITTDLDSLESMKQHHWEEDDAKAMMDAIGKHTKRHFENRAFTNEQHTKDFFGELGFSIKAQPMIDEGMTLSTLQADSSERVELEKNRDLIKLWVLVPTHAHV